ALSWSSTYMVVNLIFILLLHSHLHSRLRPTVLDLVFPTLSHLPGFLRQHYDEELQDNVTGWKENNLKMKSISYWMITAAIAFAIGSRGMAELARVPGTVEGIVHLGYSAYFATIIGFWKVMGAIAIGEAS